MTSMLLRGRARAEQFLREGIENWRAESRISDSEAETLVTSLDDSEVSRGLLHFSVHFAISLPLRFPFGALSRFFYTLALRLWAEFTGLIKFKRPSEARRLHTLPVMLFALLPGLGRLAYFLSPVLAHQRLFLVIPSDQLARKLPFQLYSRFHLAALFLFWAAPKDEIESRSWTLARRLGRVRDRLSGLAVQRAFFTYVLVLDGVVFLAGAAIYFESGRTSTWWFDERGVIAIVDTVQLVIAGVVGLAVYRLFWQKAADRASLADSAGIFLWGIAGVALLLFAIDDFFTIHETLGSRVQELIGLQNPGTNSPDDLLVLAYSFGGFFFLYLFRHEVMAPRNSSTLLLLGGAASVIMTLTDAFAHQEILKALELPSQTLAGSFLMFAAVARFQEVAGAADSPGRELRGRGVTSHPLTRRETLWVRNSARLLAVSASLVFAFLAVERGPPVAPEGPGIVTDIQYGFVVLGILATALAWWRPLPGGGLLVLTGLALGVAAAGSFSTETSLFVALLFVIPGALFLVLWFQWRPLFLQLGAVATILGLMVYSGLWAEARHDNAFGAAHPQSQRVALPVDRVEWMWSGAVASDSVKVNAKLVEGTRSARLVVSESEDLTEAFYSERAAVDQANGRTVSLSLDGLTPNTRYHYAVEVDGELDQGRRGSFRSFPVGPASFTVAVSSCARTGSNGLVFETIASYEPLAYLISGDFHYGNITSNDLGAFSRAYDRQLGAPAQAFLYSQTPIAYVWDDHDYGGNNSDGGSQAREAARLAYRQNVPHYDLPAGDGDAANYQAFTIGRVRFLMTDTRSERNNEQFDGADSLLGSRQLEWLKGELLAASKSHALIVWVNAIPWIAPEGSGRDDWGGYSAERREIADFMAESGISNLLMVSGDAHMLGIDDGRNSNYSTGGEMGFPVMHAGALDRPGSTKGGPMSEGVYPGAGQFGLVSVEDDGETVSVELTGLNWLGETVVSYSFIVD